jgi:hypothetical protein
MTKRQAAIPAANAARFEISLTAWVDMTGHSITVAPGCSNCGLIKVGELADRIWSKLPRPICQRWRAAGWNTILASGGRRERIEGYTRSSHEGIRAMVEAKREIAG